MSNSILNKKFRYSYSHVTYYLIAINIVMFLLTNYTSLAVKGFPAMYAFSLVPELVREGFWWQIFTYMFMHGSLSHLFFNMYALLIFGDPIERELGSKEFLLYYMVCGTLSGVANYLISPLMAARLVVILGASGAIYSILFLVSVLAPGTTVLLFFILPLKMPIAVLLMLFIEIGSQVFGLNNGTAHLVHLSGLVFAWIYCAVRFKIKPIEAWKSAF